MVDKAAEVVQQLHEHNRELHFSRDESSNRVVIEVRDLEGNVIKTIPPAKALDIMSGARAVRRYSHAHLTLTAWPPAWIRSPSSRS